MYLFSDLEKKYNIDESTIKYHVLKKMGMDIEKIPHPGSSHFKYVVTEDQERKIERYFCDNPEIAKIGINNYERRMFRKGDIPKPKRILSGINKFDKTLKEILGAENITCQIARKDNRTADKYYIVLAKLKITLVDLEDAIEKLEKGIP